MMHGFWSAAFAAVLLVAFAPCQQPAGSQPAAPTGHLLPRPVDAEERESLGYPPARTADQVLAEVDAVTQRMAPIAAENAVWKKRWPEYRALQFRRISLISELEEAGYRGARLDPLLQTKLADWSDLTGLTYGRWNSLVRTIARSREGTRLAGEARARLMWRTVKDSLRCGLRVHPEDYEKIADAELGWKHHEFAGVLLLDALHRANDEALTQRWHGWILEHLPSSSYGHRTVSRLRTFGKPVRLQGTSLDGGEIDTADWKGDVILVDFWGTWCAPCKAAMPKLQRVLNEHQDRGLRVLGVLCDHELDVAREFLREKGFDWPQLADNSLTADDMMHPIAKRYNIGAFPTLWVIDRKGVLRERVAAEDLEQEIEQYLAEPK